MPELNQKPAPETEILSVTNRLSGEGEGTSPEQELPSTEPGALVEETQPEETVVTQPEETVDESGQPTGDRVRDAQRALHAKSQENATLRKALELIANQQQIPPQQPQIPLEFFSPIPIRDEVIGTDPDYPAKFVQRQNQIIEYRREQADIKREYMNFVDTHPDLPEMFPVMQKIRNLDPDAYQGTNALRRLYRHAKDQQELEGYREALKNNVNEAQVRGAQQERTKPGKVFVSPSGGQRIPQSNIPPKEFNTTWTSNQRLEWLREHGLVKDSNY